MKLDFAFARTNIVMNVVHNWPSIFTIIWFCRTMDRCGTVVCAHRTPVKCILLRSLRQNGVVRGQNNTRLEIASRTRTKTINCI